MDWHEKLAAEWPAPRDDEPSSLRQDIADELADHLCCALHRERHATPDAKRAEQKVLDRFGDPAKVARKLWLDEMWEKVMLQRATLAVTAIIAAALVAACVLLAMVLQQNRTVNEAILQKLANISAPAAELKSLEWNPVKIHLVTGKPGGPPAKGFHVSLQGNIVGTTKSGTVGTVQKTTDKNGLADFGLVRPGYYTLVTTSPWSETMTKQITVRPGTTEPFEVVCPAGPRKKVEATLSVDWPKDLKQKNLWLICDFSLRPRKLEDGYWSIPSGALATNAMGRSSDPPGGRSVFLSPERKLVVYRRFRQGNDYTQLRIKPQGLEYPTGESLVLADSVQWEQGEFALLSLAVMQPTAMTVEGSKQTTLTTTVVYPFRGPSWWQTNGFSVGGGGGFFSVKDNPSAGALGRANGPMTELRVMQTTVPAPTFRVIADQPNHWTIHLPDDLVKRVRARLVATKRGGKRSKP